MPEPRSISLVLADDSVFVREGFAAFCEDQTDLFVAGQCSDGVAALEMIRALRPDFAILDIFMPKMTGIQVLRQVKDAQMATRVIILTIVRDEALVLEALHAGADAYLLKDGPGRHLLDAISYIRNGGVYVTPLLRGARLLDDGVRSEKDGPVASLSKREYEIFQYLANGMRAKEIADMLSISPKTADTYRASLMRKLNVHDLVSLVKFAIEHDPTRNLDPPARWWRPRRLADMLRHFWTSSGIPERFQASLTLDPLPTEPPPDMRDAIYRAAREALDNASRHSGATAISMSLTSSRGSVRLTVEDNGRGFDPSARGACRGNELNVIREQIQALRGELRISSSPAGTKLEVSVPLEWVN